ncbi:MAG: fibronectin type III domain-containing protein [Candidatus Pacebacteria bacterium]|jgi:hypothetical protein|nr:fibronectin type III domain-containing protein [Candidatus Paceibacterota bacterium]MBT4652525.1 fibronectin type III domain-containing protein [Candidatus Paceibacterota bacterium]MBT6756352.1 fibronectin type III domain-containing protein [Candidatus Paceibacterota bacterium]MBT6921643.1 fibronectin type III domain-containing protein [Candidatus Paceibacterota bacterium]
MKNTVKKTSLGKKQIPTLLGLGILIVSLVAGLLMFGDGTGVFAPRATPQTTPKNVKVTNLTDKSFTVVFYTDESTNGFVKFGTSANSLKSQSSDDRDQLSGSVGNYRLHHVTVRGLTPNTNYSYNLGTASGSGFDNNGVPFSVKTLATPAGAPPTNKTVYGTVSTEAGAPAQGSVVFVKVDGIGEMSTLIKSSGSWALALSNARKLDGSGYMELTDDNQINIVVQGVEPTKVSSFSNKIANSQPVPEVVLGQSPQIQNTGVNPVNEAVIPQESASDIAEKVSASAQGGGLESLTSFLDEEAGADEIPLENSESTLETIAAEVALEVLDLSEVEATEKPVMVTQPIIKGTAAPNVEVSIEVHSDAEVIETLTADSDGDFTLNLIELKKILDPGEHTVTFSYVDPTSGETVTQTQTFLVQATDAFAENTSPFGSGNPFPLETTPTPVVEATASVTPATRSAIVSTDSGTYKSGSVGNTVALIIGGLFFMFTGLWSWWLAHEVDSVE